MQRTGSLKIVLAVVFVGAIVVALNWQTWPVGTAWIEADKPIAYQIEFLDKDRAQFLADTVADYKLSADKKKVDFSWMGTAMGTGAFKGGMLYVYPAAKGTETMVFKPISKAELEKYDDAMRQATVPLSKLN